MKGRPPVPSGYLVYFGRLKILSVTKGLLLLCIQSHGSFATVSKGDVSAAEQQRHLCLGGEIAKSCLPEQS